MSLLLFCSSFKDRSEDSVLTRKSKSPLLAIIIINTVLTVAAQEQQQQQQQQQHHHHHHCWCKTLLYCLEQQQQQQLSKDLTTTTNRWVVVPFFPVAAEVFHSLNAKLIPPILIYPFVLSCKQKLSKPKHVPEFRDYVVEGEEGTGTQFSAPLPHPQISSHSFWILGIIFFLLHKKP
jgi:hypothetical protein